MTQTKAGRDMPKAYDPKSVEPRIYDAWTRDGRFTPKIDRSKRPSPSSCRRPT